MKKPMNEGILTAARKLSDLFFDGLKSNTVDRVITKAKKVNLDPLVVKQMEKIKKEKEELDKLMGL